MAKPSAPITSGARKPSGATRVAAELKPFTIRIGRGKGSLVTIQPPATAPPPARARRIDRAVERYFAGLPGRDG